VAAVIVLAPSLSFVVLGTLRDAIPLSTQLRALPEYLSDTFIHGDLGYSAEYAKPLVDVVRDGLPVDLELLAGGVVLGVGAGLATAMASAARRGRPVDRALAVGSAAALSVPVYWFGFAVLVLFAPNVGYVWQIPFVSSYGAYVPLSDDPLKWLQALWVPWVALALPLAAMCHRMARAALADALLEDHVRTARAKGVREALVMRRHALRTALPPVIALVSVNMALMVTNVILIETAFRLPGFFHEAGVGQFLGEETGHLPGADVVQALILEAAVLISIAMLLADLLHARLDPRARAVG
jgi:peptide/nickel transport system permease protein